MCVSPVPRHDTDGNSRGSSPLKVIPLIPISLSTLYIRDGMSGNRHARLQNLIKRFVIENCHRMARVHFFEMRNKNTGFDWIGDDRTQCCNTKTLIESRSATKRTGSGTETGRKFEKLNQYNWNVFNKTQIA